MSVRSFLILNMSQMGKTDFIFIVMKGKKRSSDGGMETRPESLLIL
jgi:hypothetical protein